jgi:hypothetical protein
MAGLLGSVALALGMSGEAKAGFLDVKVDSSLNKPSVYLVQYSGGSENYDGGLDSPNLSNPSNSLDIYSKTSFSYPNDKLDQDVRGADSLTTFYTEVIGTSLTSPPVSANLSFSISDVLGENNFVGKNIFADLYDSSHNLLGTYNVKDLAASGDTIPITVNNGISYYMDVRFTPEPATLALLGLGAASLIARGRRKRNRAE